jgi:ferredoxin--NADP+ reductase
VTAIAEDLASLPEPAGGREQLDALLARRRPDVVAVDGWRAIDAHERERGQVAGRGRVKLASRDELLDVAGAR